jgi:hypothetical protein
MNGGEDLAIAGRDEIAHHSVAWFVLPGFMSAVVWLVGDSEDVVFFAFSTYGSPHLDCFVQQGDEDHFFGHVLNPVGPGDWQARRQRVADRGPLANG